VRFALSAVAVAVLSCGLGVLILIIERKIGLF